MAKEETIYVRLSKKLRGRIEREATARDESLSVVVRDTLRRHYELQDSLSPSQLDGSKAVSYSKPKGK